MKIIIVGSQNNETIKFNDTPIALKILPEGHRAKYYDFLKGKITSTWNSKRKRLIDALIKKNNNGSGNQK